MVAVVLLAAGAGCADDAAAPAAGGTSAESPTTTTAALDAVAAETVVVEPTTPLDETARAAAAAFRDDVGTALAAAGRETTADLSAAGFEPMPGDPVHWFDPAALADGREVDPTRPEFAMVDGDRVVGVMFVAAARPDGSPPPDPPGAPLARWHQHRWDRPVCLGHDGLVVSGPAAVDGVCPAGQVARTESPYMVHVWLDGDDPFSEEMAPHGHQHG